MLKKKSMINLSYLNVSWSAKRINHCTCNVLRFKVRVFGEKTVTQLLFSATVGEYVGLHLTWADALGGHSGQPLDNFVEGINLTPAYNPLDRLGL